MGLDDKMGGGLRVLRVGFSGFHDNFSHDNFSVAR